MYKGKRVTAIICAAGSGSRIGGPLPKQFLPMGSSTILAHAVEPFQNTDSVDNILVIAGQDFVQLCEKILKGYSKISEIIPGGATRQESVRSGIAHVQDGGIVLIHDGARPYADEGLIGRVLEAAEREGAAVPVIPCRDTVRQVQGEDSITLDRGSLRDVQTPQGFAADIIREAVLKAENDGFEGTDDASLAERLGYHVELVAGSDENIKITTREDLPVETRVGSGFDVHELKEGRKLILGGVEIPYEKGLLGHSDADVLAHALMDAMLGAAALGDIGQYFPDSDPEYEGISSLTLLRRVKALVEDAGYCFCNGDVTVIAQKPKMAPYIGEMRANLAEALEVSVSQISIKATTTEKLGFAGRGEGIAAEAVCLLKNKI